MTEDPATYHVDEGDKYNDFLTILAPIYKEQNKRLSTCTEKIDPHIRNEILLFASRDLIVQYYSNKWGKKLKMTDISNITCRIRQYQKTHNSA